MESRVFHPAVLVEVQGDFRVPLDAGDGVNYDCPSLCHKSPTLQNAFSNSALAVFLLAIPSPRNRSRPPMADTRGYRRQQILLRARAAHTAASAGLPRWEFVVPMWRSHDKHGHI